MKYAVWLLVAAPWVLAADETSDRAAIDKLISALKDARVQGNARTGDLLASDVDRAEFNRELAALDAGMVDPSKGIWTEVGPAAIIVRSVRFLTPDVALVDGASVQIGSLMTQRVAFLLIAKRENAAWKIAVLRTVTSAPARMQLVRAGPQ
jgi:hypothetical protein